MTTSGNEAVDRPVPGNGRTLAILGAGVMGETVLSGLVRAGWSPDRIVATDRRPERQLELAGRYGITMLDNVEAATGADTILLVVKPQDMADLLTEIAPELRPGQLLVSLAAGITTSFIESHLPDVNQGTEALPAPRPVEARQGEVRSLAAPPAPKQEHDAR